MKYPGTIVRNKCAYAERYTGQRYPTCGCKTCWTIWDAKATMTQEDFEQFLTDTVMAWDAFAASVR